MPRKKVKAVKYLIYKKLRADIITGKKAPGSRLLIDELKNEFGTSVTPVRDALQMLNQEELITIKPRAGYYVALVSLKELHDMLELRQILELAAVEKAAEKISDDQIQSLEKVHAGYTDDDDATYPRYIEENRNFHCLIASASGNQELALQIGHIHDRLARFTTILRSGRKMIDIHGRLLKHLKANDPAKAKAELQKELDEAKNAIMDKIMEQEASSWHMGTMEK